jgi:glutamate-5-semialdehyde dehydrogenase
VLAAATGEQKNRFLRRAAVLICEKTAEIVAANQVDVAAAPGYGLSGAAIDRLKLTQSRLKAAAAALEEIATLTDPIGEVIEGSVRPNGLAVSRVRVPLGVVFFIYESRPNVTVDSAGLCV